MASADDWMIVVARRLAGLRDRVAFLGGAVLGLLLDAPAAGGVRATDDVDVVIDIASRIEQTAVEERLRDLGFRNDSSEGAPTCRWRIDDITVDIMPTSPEILGFSNAWYAEALATSTPHHLAPNLTIRLVKAPYFIATKLEAFRGRGKSDYVASHDLEDVVSIIDGRDALLDEARATSDELRRYLATAFRTLLDTPAFQDAILGHVGGDDDRARVVGQRMRALANLASWQPAAANSRQVVPRATAIHATYWAHSLRLAPPRDRVESLTRSLGNARVDLNPHQIDAALFALRSPYARGVLLADEVGLGKTIEAALVMAQKWAERRRRLLLIAPATLRKQWQQELESKFFLDSIILETKSWNAKVRSGKLNPFDTGDKAVVICSYQFAYAKRVELAAIGWDLVVIDEAHRLRNIYKGTKTAVGIAEAIADRRKVLLTATPLQNSLAELHGLVSILDDSIFGDLAQFNAQFVSGDGFVTLEDRDLALRERIRPVCKRTLRRDVAGFIKFTNRLPVTASFTNSPTEQQLYDEVSAFLQREELLVLPSGQRPLLTLVLRKLLASSTRAIGATLAKFVDRIQGEELVADYEVSDDPSGDDPSFEAASPPEPVVSTSPPDATAETRELADLQRFIELAQSVARDSKATCLLGELPRTLDDAVARGARRKAVIFTESVRTQAYLAELLADNGYADQIVLLNGTNNDATSKRIFKAYQARHKARWAEVSSGSKTADMKAALVEEFDERATLLIATESAAEGVNLQFCSVVINYDLPWNPQRIEQRIGRCHRYGQRSDVVVVNFKNQSNQADVRVHELLAQKLGLFAGVFGASDEVLGATVAAGIDFERAISEIYQRCRTNDEIDRAFDALQRQLDDVICAGREQTRRAVLDHLDADLHTRLMLHRDQAKAALDGQQQMLLDLARFGWGGRGTFAADAPRFAIELDGVMRHFNLDWRDAESRDEEFFRVDHPAAVELIDTGARTEQRAQDVVFEFKNHASALAVHVGSSGWFDLCLVRVTALDRVEESMVVVGCNDAGEELPSDVVELLFRLEGTATPLDAAPEAPDILARLRGTAVAVAVGEAEKRNQRLLSEEADKIERRTEDEKQAVDRRIAQLETDYKAAQRAARGVVMLDEQLAANRARDDLKRKLDEARRRRHDEIDKLEIEQDDLTEQMQRALRERKVSETTVATFRWRLIAPTPSSNVSSTSDA